MSRADKHIENFKSIKKLDFSPDQTISILIGRNNVGKSNILDALWAIGKALEERREIFKNRGGYQEFVYGKDPNLGMVFDLCFIFSKEEIKNLYSKLNLKEADFDQFNAIISNGLRFKVQLGVSRSMDYEPTLIEEELFLYDDGKEIQYAKGYWEKNSYNFKVVKNLVEGLRSKNWLRLTVGGGKPPTSVLQYATYHSGLEPEWQIPLSIWGFIENNQKKQVSDSIALKEDIQVVRYKGAKNIGEIMERGQYIEAFTHAQLGIEKILWDKIVGIFEGEKAMIVGRAIEESKEDKSKTTTYELIKWAHFLGAINDNEFSDLMDFNKKRNKIIHGHGKWWDLTEYSGALQKGVRFLENNCL